MHLEEKSTGRYIVMICLASTGEELSAETFNTHAEAEGFIAFCERVVPSLFKNGERYMIIIPEY